MTKVSKNSVKCAVCGYESEQLIVYSVNSLLGTKEDNDKLMNNKQKCPKCGYESKDISKRDYFYKENDYMKIAIPSYWKEYSVGNIGHPIFKFDPIGTKDVKVMFRFYGMVEYSPTIYGMYTIEKLGTGSLEIYDKEFNKIVESIKNDSVSFNILRLSNVQIDGKFYQDSKDLCVKRIYLEYLKSKTVSILDLVWVKGEIYIFNCPICESTNIDTVFENTMVNIENSIISSIIVKKSDNELINKVDNKISNLKSIEEITSEVIKIFNSEVDDLKYRKIDEQTFYFYENIKGGKSIIISKNGEYLCASSGIDFEKLIEEFQKGEKNKNFNIDERKEELNKKVEASKYLIGYSKGSLRPGNTIFTSIIIVDDLIYKAIDGKVEYLENQKEKIDKVWDYVNLMQGNIRTEAERIKQLPHVKDTARDEITFKINGEMFTLTSKIADEAGINFYNKIVNEILEIIK